MKIDNIKDLNKLIATCRKLGVEEIEVDGVKLKLGSEPEAKVSRANRPVRQLSVHETVAETIETSGLTDEDMLFYSALGPMGDVNES